MDNAPDDMDMQRLKLALDASKSGVWDWYDVTKDDVYWSSEWKRMLGFDPDDDSIQGKVSIVFNLIHPDDVATVRQDVESSIANEGYFDSEFRINRLGEYRWYHARGSAFRDKRTGAIRLIGVISDIHRLKEAEKKLAEYAERLKRSNEELHGFAHIASHDLKEPLRGIHNYASLLVKRYSHQFDEKGQRMLGRMEALTQKMEDIIDGLLYYSQVDRLDMSRKKVDLQEVMLNVVDLYGPLLDATGTSIRLPKLFPKIHCDAVRIEEVFRNLIVNAIKYNDKINKWVEVGYTGTSEKDYIFYVKDNGIGIKKSHQPKVFHMFKKIYGRGVFSTGLGTGLAIVSKIISRLGGKIWLDSTPGEGTCFYFTINEG